MMNTIANDLRKRLSAAVWAFIILVIPSISRPDVSLNDFEGANLGLWAWGNPSVCSPLLECVGLAGPCIDVVGSSTATEGVQSGLVRLQGTDSDRNCGGYTCGNEYRKMDLSLTANNNWSSGYTRVALDVKNGGPELVTMGIGIDNGTLVIPDTVPIPAGGGWQTIYLIIQDFKDLEMIVSNVSKVVIKFEPVTECATIWVDNLRLISGTPPNPPTSVTVSPTGTSGELRVDWTAAVGGVDHYEIYYDLFDNSNINNMVKAGSTTGVSFSITGLGNGTEYFVKVVAFDALVDGNRSAAAPASPSSVHSSPVCMLAPSPFSAWPITGSVRLTWDTTVNPAPIYKIYKAENSITCATKGAVYYTTPGSTNFYDDRDVTIGHNYCYIIQGWDGVACTSACSTDVCANFTNTGCAPPGTPPGSLGVLSFSVPGSSSEIIVSWGRPTSGSSPLDYYELNRISPLPRSSVVDETGLPSYSAADWPVQADTVYTYQVKGVCVDTACTALSVIASQVALAPPQNVVALACSDRVRLTFNAPLLKGSSYVVYKSTWTGNCTDFQALGMKTQFSSTCIYYDDFNVTAGETYFYTIASKGNNGTSFCSPEVNAGFPGAGPCPCYPPGPIDLSAMPGADRVRLTWIRPAEGDNPISRFIVKRSLVPGNPVAQEVTGTVYDDGSIYITYTATGLSAKTPYCFTVYSEDITFNCGSTSFEQCVTTQCMPIIPNGPVSVTPLNGTDLFVAWARPTIDDLGAPLSGYRVWHSTCAGCLATAIGPSFIQDDASPEFSLTHMGQNLASTNCYRVQISDVASCSTFTAEKCRTCGGPGAFGITGVTAMAGGSPYANNLAIAWTAAPKADLEITRYIIRRSTVSGTGPWTISGTVYAVNPTDPLFFVDTLPGTMPLIYENYYDVTAVDLGGCTLVSATKSHSCMSLTAGTVAAVSNTVTGATINLLWAAATQGELSISYYRVWRSTVPGGTRLARPNASTYVYPTGPLVLADTLAGGKQWNEQYCWEITAVDESGCSVDSASACYNCTPPTWSTCDPAFGAPPALNTDFTTIDSSSILVSWNRAVDGDTLVSKYFLFRSTDAVTAPSVYVATVWSDGCAYPCSGTCPTRFSFTDTGLASAAIFNYSVLAVSMTGCTEMSNSGMGGTKGGCAFLSSPTAATLPSSVVLKWSVTFNGTIAGYEVWRGNSAAGKTSAGKILVAPNLPPTSASFTDAGLLPATSYCYVIVLKVNPSCSVFSEEVCTDTVKMTAYPNPAKLSEGPVRFDGLSVGSVVEVYTINGELIKKYTASSGGLWAWDGNNDSGSIIAGGVYLYLIRDGNKITKRGKLVINR